jgi:cell division protein FtsW
VKKTINDNNQKIKSSKLPKRIDIPLLVIVIILVSFGLVMVLSASTPIAVSSQKSSDFYFIRQCKAAAIGLVLMIFFAFFNYKHFQKFYWIFYILSIGVLFLTKIDSIGLSSGGAGRWVRIAGVSFQPSELSKIGLIISMAGYYSSPKRDFTLIRNSIVKPLVLIAIPIGILFVVENHLSAALIVGIVNVIMLFMSGISLAHIGGFLLTILGGVAGLFMVFKDKFAGSFRNDRIEAWLHTEENSATIGYQTMQGLYAIGSGGMFGVGFGNSTQKYSYVPAAHNDFIFSILVEELGFAGGLVIIVLFALFAVKGFLIALSVKDKFGSLLAIGITSLITIQAILNIAVVTNLVPNTGISLPFLSYGGTSLLILMTSVGILLNVSKSATK